MASPQEVHELLREPLRLGRGRRASQINVSYAGDLTVEDLLKASTQPAPTSGGPVVLELRQSHHNIARLIGQGAGTNEVSAITGMTPSRISTMKGDPAFQELVAYYAAMDSDQYALARADMHKRLAALGFDSLAVLHERVLEKPDEFDNKTLLAVVEASADRTGHGKTSTVNHDHSHSLSSHTIAALKAATNEGRALTPEDRGALLRIAAERTAEVHPEGQTIDGEPGSWSCLREEGDPLDEAALPSGQPALP